MVRFVPSDETPAERRSRLGAGIPAVEPVKYPHTLLTPLEEAALALDDGPIRRAMKAMIEADARVRERLPPAQPGYEWRFEWDPIDIGVMYTSISVQGSYRQVRVHSQP